MGRLTDGILLVDKAVGETSGSVVRRVKSAFSESKACKVGHAGTLDPFATGLLIILVGQGTKLSRLIMSEDKVYQATMRLGVETDTLDYTGKVVRMSAVTNLSPDQIRDKAQDFVGVIEQTPPAYSAVKYKGTRAYKLARRGHRVSLRKREAVIHAMRIVSINLPDVSLVVVCASGTYIRSLAADLGRELGPGAHLISLRRMAIGSFSVSNALSSCEILKEQGDSLIRDRLISLRAALPRMSEIQIGRILAKKIGHGLQPDWHILFGERSLPGTSDGLYKLVYDRELVAIVKVNNEDDLHKRYVTIERVFV